MSDTDLLDRTDLQDYGAFAGLYFGLRAQIHRYVAEVLTDPATAAEVTDAVFVEMWHLSHRPGGPPTDALIWALAIARRRCGRQPGPGDRHLRCQLAVLLAAAGARPPAPCACEDHYPSTG